ncbi:MAG: hypothetical protein EXS67_00160 [Candidatus Margulisbacteria bacterium]|nr:hypothetical protein [Candidatus Margulisiibacteriota bacterium]
MSGVNNDGGEDSVYSPNSISQQFQSQFTQLATNEFMDNLIKDVKEQASLGPEAQLGASLQQAIDPSAAGPQGSGNSEGG